MVSRSSLDQSQLANIPPRNTKTTMQQGDPMNVSHEGAKANNTKYDKTKKKQKTCARRTKLKVYIPLSSFYYPKFDSSPLYSLF